MSELTLLQKLSNLSREMVKWVKAGLPLVSEPDQAERIGSCSECDKISPDGRCSECGCNMAWKSWLATAQCPLPQPKWLAKVAADRPKEQAQWFFEQPENAKKFRIELLSWVGTRFFRNAAPAKKGVRADCVSFVEALLVNVGAIKPIKWPAYVTHSGGEAMLELLLKRLRSMPQFAELPLNATMIIGDVLVYSSGRAHHHLAFFYGDNTIWHATEDGGGVCSGNVNDPVLSKRLVAIFRVK